MRYSIPEENMERLEKKMTRIRKKCAKYGCDFHYEVVGEEMRKFLIRGADEEPRYETLRCVIVEAEGTAKINGWSFVAGLEHTEAGNIIEGVKNVEVPERYYHCEAKCEHCKTSRARKSTYIVYNEESGEFKQVGRSCLCDYTGGLSAECAADMLSWVEDFRDETELHEGVEYRMRYYPTDEYLRFAAETVRLLGYVKRGTGELSSADMALGFMKCSTGYPVSSEIKARYDEAVKTRGFNPDGDAAKEMVAGAIKMVTESTDTSNWMHNMKTAIALKYTDFGKIGILCSVFPAYNRDLEHKAEEARKAEEAAKSEYFGEVGKRVDFVVSKARCLTSWMTDFGCCYLLEFRDDCGHVFVWKTSNGYTIDKAAGKKLVGTVKEFNEFRGMKQTVLTRCRLCA